jgi:hypothetical protein
MSGDRNSPATALKLAQKRRAVLVDTLICVLIPMIEMVLGKIRCVLEQFGT